ncbi:MAG: tetratricopeptide repeat protein [Rhodospirillales bacterium]
MMKKRFSNDIRRRPRNGRFIPILLALMVPAACASSDFEMTNELGPIGHNPALSAAKPLELGKSFTGHYIAGRHAQSEREMNEAATYLEQALKLDPKNPALLRRTFILMIAEGRMQRAFALAERLIAVSDNAPIASLALISRDFRDKKYAAASARLDTLPDRGLNAFLVPLLRAWALQGQGETQAALKALLPLSKRKGSEVLYDLHAALIHEVAGQNTAAEPLFEKIRASQNGSSLRMAKLLGSFYERRDNPEKALALYEEHLKHNPNSRLFEPDIARIKSGKKPEAVIADAIDGVSEGLFGIASSLRQQNAEETALVIGQLGLYIKPDFPIMRILIGGILDQDERYDSANAVYGKIDKTSPFSWPAQLRIASNLDKLDRTEEAVAMLEAMAKQHADKPDPLIDLGDILRSRERFAEAVKAYDRAFARIKEIKSQHWSLFYARGISLEQSKQWPRAEADFLKALEFEPEQPYVLNYLGYSWIDRGKHLTKAQDMIRKAVSLRPNDGYIVDSLGWVYYMLGNYEDAVPELERAVELRPQDPVINDHLGDAYWRVGRVTEARFQWSRVLDLKAEKDLAAKVRKKLKNGLIEAAKIKVEGDGP